jgi:hypothetical protein
MCFILQPWCQIQGTSCRLRYLDCGSGHIQCTYSPTYAGFNIQLNVSPPLLEIYRQFNVRYTANMVPNTAHILQFRYLNCGPGHIHCNYSSTYICFNIRWNVSALLFKIIGHYDARYTANLAYVDCGPGHIQCNYSTDIQVSIFSCR